MAETKYASVLDARESLLDSVLRDLVTFIFTGFLMFISIKYESAWWTLITGSMFVFVVLVKVSGLIGEKQNIFHNKAELQEWVDRLPDDKSEIDVRDAPFYAVEREVEALSEACKKRGVEFYVVVARPNGDRQPALHQAHSGDGLALRCQSANLTDMWFLLQKNPDRKIRFSEGMSWEAVDLC